MRVLAPAAILCAMLIIALVALGAHTYRWEAVLWQVAVIGWAITAWSWREVARRR